MLPGKKYKPEDLLHIAWRHRWILVLPLVVTLSIGLIYAYSLDERYMSSALIQVVPQRVPESYVRTTVTTRVEDRLESVRQLILSRTKLEALIQEFDLYPAERQMGLMEDVVHRMRVYDIRTEVTRGDTFRISFTSGNPRTAMRVTERLAGLFIEENLRDRSLLAESSAQFLQSQLADARVRLEETERKLAAYRRQFGSQLPDQALANLTGVTNSQMQMNQLSESINRDRDQRMLVQRQIADLQNAPPDVIVPTTGSQDTQVLAGTTAAEQLEQARANLRNMQLRFTDAHPDIVRAKRIISDLERKAEQEALQQPLSPSAPRPVATSPVDASRRARLKELQNQLASLDSQINSKTNEEARLRGVAAQYQSRVDAAPTRESELIALTRDYSTINEQYQSLLRRNEEAKMSANLERRQGGEQFRLLDPARLPERPFEPNRRRIVMISFAFGLMIGLGIVALLEYRDKSLRTDDDVMLTLALPVLAVVPRMVSQKERQTQRKRRLMFSAAGAATLMCAAAVFVWRFVQWRELLPW
jgi:polysaccharide chain length determinant protein (PEP-CTERM system associated)